MPRRGLNFHVQSLWLLCQTQVCSARPIRAQRHVPSCKRQGSRGLGVQSPLLAVSTHGSAQAALVASTAPCSVSRTPLNRAVARGAKGALTLFRIFLPTSITTYTIALSIKLRSPSTLMMEHSRPFSTLGMIADGSALHHSDENPWVQTYFISLQHVSAFSLAMMSIQ